MCVVHTPRVVVIQIVSMVMCMGAAYFDHKAGGGIFDECNFSFDSSGLLCSSGSLIGL